MFARIVVGTDGSERAGIAVERAAALAELCQADIALVQGCGSPIVGAPMLAGEPFVTPEQLTEGAEPRLEAIAEPLRARGLTVSTHAMAIGGDGALCQVASELGADLIVVGNRGMTGAARFLGSVPNAVTHQAPCSVLVVATD